MIDKLKQYRSYRVVLWLIKLVFSIGRFIFIDVLFALFQKSLSASPYEDYEVDRRNANADDIWDGHPKHYYDDEPPKPFS